QLPFPVFVKGGVKSNKDEGWSGVVANNTDELTIIATRLFARKHRSRGKVIVRELVDLNIVATDPASFPIGREYRAFLYKGEILAYGFYWDEYDDSQSLSGTDQQAFLNCLRETARRVDVPFMSVDIGQQKNGDWVIIEIGDGQFSGLSQIPVLELWSKIKDLKID
ncbi:MAG: ATP-grasp domain-containing protein, partial [Anaerolineaceae bacterium]|nr:ATP-grasp domain-containing protein [Anaerolineaceae bacterium]